jgi:hypothetical protein
MKKNSLTTCYRAGNAAMKPGYVIGFAYDEEAVEAIKKRIPHTEREWRSQYKVWWISEKYESVLDELFGNFDALAHQQACLFDEARP